MKDKRNGIIFSLCLLVLLLCGMLPFFTAWGGDFVSKETITYHKMKTVQIYPEVNDIQKLYLLKSETFIPVSEKRCKLKKEDMGEIIENALAAYIDSNLIQGTLCDFSLECEPFRYYSVEDANLSSTIWVIRMELWDDLGQSIVVYLDDQDGKVLSLSYDCLNLVYETGTLSERVWVLSGIYLSYMDWMNTNVNEETSGVEPAFGYEKKNSSLSYHVGDIGYGEIEIRFAIGENGFRIYVEN